MYKVKLQELCQKQKWALPKYSYVKEGPDHNPSFRGSVVVKGVIFDTTTDSKSSKEAQNDAARLAFHYFTASEPSEESKTGQSRTEIHQAEKLQANSKESKKVAGEPLRALLKTPQKMISDTLLAKKGAPSLAGRTPDTPRDYEGEETSKLRSEPAERGDSLEVIVEDLDKEVVSLSMDRKRQRKEVEWHPCHHSKGAKDDGKSKSEGAVKLVFSPCEAPNQSPVTPGGEPLPRVIVAAKTHLDQLVANFDKLVVLSNREDHGVEVLVLRQEVVELKKQKGDADAKMSAALEREREALEVVDGLRTRVEALTSNKGALEALIESYHAVEVELTATIMRMKKEHESALAVEARAKAAMKVELDEARDALAKSTEKAFGALESGYALCWKCASKAGYDMTNHTFQHHCEDVARARNEAGSCTRPAESST